MAEWLDKKILWLSFGFVAVVCICGALGVKGVVFSTIMFISSAVMAFVSLIAAQHKKFNFVGVVAWTLLAVYSGLMLMR